MIEGSAIPVFDKTNMVSYREEKDGYITVTPPNRVKVERKILNSTSKTILDLCDSKNTVSDIVDSVCKMYPDSEREVVDNDVRSILKKMWMEDIIDWKGKNPIMSEYVLDYGEWGRLRIAFEEDTRSLLSSLKNNEGFESPIDAVPVTDPLFIRHAMFSLYHLFFIHEFGDEIRNVVTLNVLGNTTVATVGNISNMNDDFSFLFSGISKLLNAFLVHKRTKLRIRINNDSPDKDKFILAGFCETTCLRNEINSTDISVLDYFIVVNG